LRFNDSVDPVFLSLLQPFYNILLVHQMLFIFAEVLRTNVFDLIELFVVFLLQSFAMRRGSIRYLQNVVFYLVSLGSYLTLQLVFQLVHGSLEGVSVL